MKGLVGRMYPVFFVVLLWGGDAAVSGSHVPSRADVSPGRKIPAGSSILEGLEVKCSDVYVSYLEIFNMYAEDIHAECMFTAGRHLEFKNIRGSFYGGTIRGKVKLTLGEKVSYRVEISFRNVDFRWFSMNFFDPATEFRGKVKGSLNVAGTTDGEVHGTLNLYLKRGYIAKLPRWFTMFSLIDVNPLKPKVISDASCRLTLERDRFVIQSCTLKTNDIDITGAGTIWFNGRADIIFNPRGKHPLLTTFLPPVAFIVRGIEKALWRVHIKGPLFALQYKISPFRRF